MMDLLLDLLRDSAWQGIGVIVSLVLFVASLYFDKNKNPSNPSQGKLARIHLPFVKSLRARLLIGTSIFILVLVVIGIFSTRTPFYSENFDSSTTAWNVGDSTYEDRTIKRSIENGKYRYEITTKNASPAEDEFPQQPSFANFEAQVDIQHISGNDEDVTYGITFRQNNDGRYVFWINDKKEYQFLYWDQNTRKWDNIIPRTANSSIRIGSANTLKVTAYGSNIKLFINGSRVYDAYDNRLVNGKIGLEVGMDSDRSSVFTLDNFKIYLQ